MPAHAFTTALSELEAAELKAQHLACSHLVRGCQDAIFQFGKRVVPTDEESLRLAQRTTDILEGILESWCETLSMVRSALDRSSSQKQPLGFDVRGYQEVLGTNSSWGQTPFVDPKSLARREAGHNETGF